MTTDLFTLRSDDIVDLAASVMAWRHIRHIPVEDDDGGLVGLITYRDILKQLANGGLHKDTQQLPVREIMKTNPFAVSPGTLTLDAIALMRRHNVGCIPVIEKGKLVGIVTASDFLNPARELFEEQLRERSPLKSEISTEIASNTSSIEAELTTCRGKVGPLRVAAGQTLRCTDGEI